MNLECVYVTRWLLGACERENARERERNKMTSYTDSQTGLLRPKVTGKLKQR